MKRKDFKTAKTAILTSLRMLDLSFQPKQVYDKDSEQYKFAADIRYIADCLCKGLVNE